MNNKFDFNKDHNKDYYNDYNKKFPNLFKELQKSQKQNLNYKLNKNNIEEGQVVKIINHKFHTFGAIIVILLLILFFTTIKSNYIFASSKDDKKVIGNFEENNNPIDIMNIISENISETIRKDISTEEKLIVREIKYIDNNQLPKDEEVVQESGSDGIKEVTYIRSYENDEMIDEKIINEHIKLVPTKRIIQRGTSEYLADYQVHIGDIMYTTTEVFMKEKPNEEAQTPCKIYKNIDVKLEEVLDKWCKVFVDGYCGYIPKDTLTSEFKEPEIVEKCRIQRIMVSLKFDMELNKPSGLTKEDFLKVLSNNPQDKNKIFEDNAGLFYELEQKYNVNGVLLAAIGIHESGWGTSKIANDKKNLFGYGAYDSSPYSSAMDFESYSEGIELLAKVLVKYYLNEAGTKIYDDEKAVASFYNGPTVSGINVRYASDPEWANKVFSKMEMLYKKLQ